MRDDKGGFVLLYFSPERTLSLTEELFEEGHGFRTHKDTYS
jgi:hypothetical protein